jgi:hypothetical protein
MSPNYSATMTLTYGFDENHQPVTGTACLSMFRMDVTEIYNNFTFFLPLFP